MTNGRLVAVLCASVLCVGLTLGACSSNSTNGTTPQDSGAPSADASVDSSSSFDAGSPSDSAPPGDARPLDSASDAPPCTPAEAGPTVDCDPDGGTCAAISVAGDPPSATSGNWDGYADPALAEDVAGDGGLWLVYSSPHVVVGTAPDGGSVNMGAVSTHLAHSADSGGSFSFTRELWAATPGPDPEGSGENGLSSSETPSIVSMTVAGTTTWYGAHERYFLQPITGYNPKYSTSWTIHVAAAASPSALGDPATQSAEAVLGIGSTAAVYAVDVKLDQLAGIPTAHCALLNNPTLFAAAPKLILAVDCVAFTGSAYDYANSTTQVFTTTPSGSPKTWTWQYSGKLADAALASAFGAQTMQQPDIARARDGSLLAILTPASAGMGTTLGAGCVALSLTSIDPPILRRDCAGKPIVRARLTGTGVSSCGYDPASVTGVLSHVQLPQTPWTTRASGVRP